MHVWRFTKRTSQTQLSCMPWQSRQCKQSQGRYVIALMVATHEIGGGRERVWQGFKGGPCHAHSLLGLGATCGVAGRMSHVMPRQSVIHVTVHTLCRHAGCLGRPASCASCLWSHVVSFASSFLGTFASLLLCFVASLRLCFLASLLRCWEEGCLFVGLA